MKKLLITISILLSVICFNTNAKYDPDAFFAISYRGVLKDQKYWTTPDFETTKYIKGSKDAEGITDITTVYQDKKQIDYWLGDNWNHLKDGHTYRVNMDVYDTEYTKGTNDPYFVKQDPSIFVYWPHYRE